YECVLHVPGGTVRRFLPNRPYLQKSPLTRIKQQSDGKIDQEDHSTKTLQYSRAMPRNCHVQTMINGWDFELLQDRLLKMTVRNRLWNYKRENQKGRAGA
ncbi:hypothetical protein CSKR_200718, partial [Clonorchis sinensis]